MFLAALKIEPFGRRKNIPNSGVKDMSAQEANFFFQLEYKNIHWDKIQGGISCLQMVLLPVFKN